MTLGSRALVVAAQEIGVREDPPGSNRGPRVDEYLRAVKLDPTRGRYAWCAAFVSWCIQQASGGWALPVQFRYSAMCSLLVSRNRGRLLAEPEPGCVFVRDDEQDHCGFVSGLRDDGDMVTIEGNTDGAGSRTGGQVMAQRRPRSYATHWIRVA